MQNMIFIYLYLYPLQRHLVNAANSKCVYDYVYMSVCMSVYN